MLRRSRAAVPEQKQVEGGDSESESARRRFGNQRGATAIVRKYYSTCTSVDDQRHPANFALNPREGLSEDRLKLLHV